MTNGLPERGAPSIRHSSCVIRRASCLANEKKVMSEEPIIHRGLDGVVVDSTRISKVMPEINSLVYAGYPVQELAEQCAFEEVAWLIWHGELPNERQLAGF